MFHAEKIQVSPGLRFGIICLYVGLFALRPGKGAYACEVDLDRCPEVFVADRNPKITSAKESKTKVHLEKVSVSHNAEKLTGVTHSELRGSITRVKGKKKRAFKPLKKTLHKWTMPIKYINIRSASNNLRCRKNSSVYKPQTVKHFPSNMTDYLCPSETSRQLRCSQVEIENQSKAISGNPCCLTFWTLSPALFWSSIIPGRSFSPISPFCVSSVQHALPRCWGRNRGTLWSASMPCKVPWAAVPASSAPLAVRTKLLPFYTSRKTPQPRNAG